MMRDTNMIFTQPCTWDWYWAFLWLSKVEVKILGLYIAKSVKRITFGENIAFSLLKRMKEKSGFEK